jgi:hypothetical protein
MEKENKRVLAYELATPISNEELGRVSGGNMQVTTRQTVKISGNSAQGPDVIYDVAADF